MSNKVTNIRWIVVAIALVLMAADSGSVFARGGGQSDQPQYYGTGMMGPAPGYRGHHGGMMHGYGPGNPQQYGRGWGYEPRSGGQRISAEQAQRSLEESLAYWGNGDLEVAEIMEFEYNYYAQVRKKGAGVNAFELLVDPYSGRVYPEPGPNMMWNTDYGHMGRRWFGGFGGNRLKEAEVERIASEWVARYAAGATVDDVTPFPGYYTLHVYENGEIIGMLSVHARSGKVWYHDWHGEFLGMVVGHR